MIEITRDGRSASSIAELPEVATKEMTGTAKMYKSSSYHPPWIGYLAVSNGECVGTCAFKTPPMDGRIEIAYFTLPESEGQNIATSTARRLIEKTMSESQRVRILAQTRAECFDPFS